MSRVVDPRSIARVRAALAARMPALANAPLLESRVCQYENTTNGHLLLDRLPGHDRVWIAGGGSDPGLGARFGKLKGPAPRLRSRPR